MLNKINISKSIKKIIGLAYYSLLHIFYGKYNSSLKIYINYQKNHKSFFSKCYIFNTNLGSAKLVNLSPV